MHLFFQIIDQENNENYNKLTRWAHHTYIIYISEQYEMDLLCYWCYSG